MKCDKGQRTKDRVPRKDITSTVSSEQMLTNIGMSVRDLNHDEESRLPMDGVLVNSIVKGGQIANVNMEENFIITRVCSKEDL